VGTQYDRVSQCAGWTAPTPVGEWNNKQTRIAYIVSGISDDEATSRVVASLAKRFDPSRFKLQVYVTECAVRRDKQFFTQTAYVAPSAKRGKETLEFLARQKTPAWIAPLDGDTLSSAKSLADQLVKDHVDVAIFDATQADPIAAVAAAWEVARVRVNFCRKTPLYSAGIACVTYFDQFRFEADKNYWQSRGVDSRFLMEGIDADEALGPPPQRSAYGIPEQAVVLATSGNELDRNLSEPFVEAIINILRAHPHAIFLAVGEGELAWQKRKFESAGVSKRVGYAGRRKDLPSFLRIADIYLAEFPISCGSGVLQAMTVERPVVAIRWGDDVEQSQAATYVGSEGAISGRDAAAYIERVSKLIREPSYRQKLGKNMRARVEQHFGFAQTCRNIEEMCDELIQQKSEAADRGPLAEVA
jgi:glycosyltransferase involved in cell wall biosynthesis